LISKSKKVNDRELLDFLLQISAKVNEIGLDDFRNFVDGLDERLSKIEKEVPFWKILRFQLLKTKLFNLKKLVAEVCTNRDEGFLWGREISGFVDSKTKELTTICDDVYTIFYR
jgi:hypothetical protein